MKQIPRGIWVLLSANVVIALGYGFIAPALPTFARTFNVSFTAATAVISAFAVMRLAFAPATGRLVTVFGERRIYLTGLLIVAASTLACAFAQSYWQLLIFRSLGGIGSTMFTVSAVALLVRMAPPTKRGRVSAAYGSAFLLGNVFGPVLGGLLAGLGLRAPFLIYGVALLIAAGAGLILWLRPAVPAPRAVPAATASCPSSSTATAPSRCTCRCRATRSRCSSVAPTRCSSSRSPARS